MGIDLVQMGSAVLVLLLSLSLHESAHAWTADRLGDPTARDLGRVSMNPWVHADLFGTIIFPLLSLSLSLGLIFGWAKPVPVNIARLKNPRKGYMLVAAAGPAANLLLALGFLLALLILKLWSPLTQDLVRSVVRGAPAGESIFVIFVSMAYFGVMINTILLLFNMIPIAPLDGAAVLSGFLPESLVLPYQKVQKFGVVILIGIVVLGVPWYFFRPIMGAVRLILIQ